jgi:hypothetical protein
VDSKSAFIKRFGDLIALLRVDPGNAAALDLALSAPAAAVETEPVEIEAGIEWNVIPEELTLKGRLLARQVDVIRIAAGAEPEELLALARALSHDLSPIQSSLNIEIKMVHLLAPPPGTSGPPDRGGEPPAPSPSAAPTRRATERRDWEERRRPGRAHYRGVERRGVPDRRVTGERRLFLIEGQQVEIARLHETLVRSARGMAWETVLAAALALVQLAPRVPTVDRRTFGIQIRRAIPRRAVESLLDLAERDASQRERSAQLLRWIGLDAAEVILDRLMQGEAVGVRAFYYDVLGGMPGVYPLVTPLLGSQRSHEIRHGAALLGRLGRPAAIEDLATLLTHRDEGVRVAGVRAIGEIHEGPAAEPLRQALHHPDPRTRTAAAEAIAVWRGGALALLLAAARANDRDPDAWQALVSSLGRIGTGESCAALATVALARRSVLRRQGFSAGQRLAAVEALGLTDSAAARTTLERLAREAEGVVRYAAGRVLEADRQRAG